MMASLGVTSALKPGVPAVWKNSGSSSGSQAAVSATAAILSLVRPETNTNNSDSFVCRFPKDKLSDKKEAYKLTTVPVSELQSLSSSFSRSSSSGHVENLLDGSLYPSPERPRELLVNADFVTCTQ